jgi:uncharacterized membrane protein
VVDQIIQSGISEGLIVVIISALPIAELRGALPVAIDVFHFSWYYALPLAILGNMLPVPIILLFLNAITRVLSKVGFIDRFLRWLFEHTRKRGRIVERYERIGLALFVAIPLPVTGAWTGSLLAVLLGLKFKHAILSIFIGVLIAGIIVTCVSLLIGLWL